MSVLTQESRKMAIPTNTTSIPRSVAGWAVWEAALGILYVIFAIASGAVSGNPPAGDASSHSLAGYFADHRTGLLVGGYLVGLAEFCLLWFAGVLRDALRLAGDAAERPARLVFGAIVVVTTLILLRTIILSSLAYRAVSDPGAMRLLYEVRVMIDNVTWFPSAALFAAAALVMIRTGAISRLLGWFALLNAALELIAGTSIFAGGPLNADQPLGFAVFILVALWFLLTAILLVRQAGQPEAATA
jgi:hypothetical protein